MWSGVITSIDLWLFATVPVCRGTSGPDSYDEHLDSAERYSYGNRNKKGLSSAAETGQISEDSFALWPYLADIAKGVSVHMYT